MKSRETLPESPDFPCPCRRISSGRAPAWPLVMVLLQLGLNVAAAQGIGPAPQPALPVSAEEPIFRLEAGGPSSLVTGLAFAPDGQTLYVAGWDKIVRVWALDRAKGEFQLDRPATFRVPIGPGLDGAINSLAVSSDAKGEWLAVAGQGLMRGMAAGFRKPGLFMPLTLIPEEMKLDQGQIEVFNTRSNPRRLRPLRGHRGGVLALAIAPIELGQPVVLASAAKEGEECVVRVWDVESGQPLATLPGLPLPTSNGDRPCLVVRRRGAGPREIDVAIAWGDGLLRLWNLAAEPAHATERRDGRYNVLIDWFGPNGLVTASYESGARAGQLRSWSQQANGGLGVGTLVQFPAANDGRVDVPRAMALFGAPPGGAPQQAAILLARLPLVQPGGPPASQIEYLLQLHSLDPALPGQVRARFTLGAVPASKPPMPVLAVAPTGEHLAVAFRPDHEVMIFSIKELLAGKSDPIQTLHSPGLTVRQAALVRKGEDWGLLLRREPKARLGDPPRTPSPGDFIVDLKTRGISAQTNGWAIPPDPAGHEWQIGHDNSSVALWRNGNLEGQVQLQPEDQLTDFALSPPGPGSVRTLPVLAVALLDRFGAPSLKLYDGATGQQVRELSGHTDTIRGLSFSGDGRWLVSASEDQTVSVWDLADLESSLEQLKRLQGVHLAPGDRGLVVQKAAEGNPLREGDRITGIIRDGKGVLLEAPGALAQSIFSNHPGEEISLWRERPNAQPEWVRIKLERAIAERKPLVSLFFAPQAAAGQTPRWLAWTPLGTYDLSDQALEDFLGWHFNIEQTDAPTRFAEAAKYRGLQRPGLLRELIMGPEPPPPLPPPRADLLLDPPGERDSEGVRMSRQPPSRLRLTVTDRSFPLEAIGSVRWSLDGGDPEPFPPTAARAWTVELQGRRLAPRRWHDATAMIRTNEPTPQEFTYKHRFRFVPEPPTIEVDRPRQREVVGEERLNVSARIKGAVEGERLRVRLLQGAGPAAGPALVEVGPSPLRFEKSIKLQPGTNVIALEVSPADLAPRDAELETHRQAIQVVFQKKEKALPPAIALRAFSALGGGTPTPARIPQGGQPLDFLVEVPRIRIDGRIEGKAALSEGTLDDGTGRVRRLSDFHPGKAAAFDFQEEIKLLPDTKAQTIRLQARVADSDSSVLLLTVRYQPPLPEIDFIEPPERVVYDGPTGQPPLISLSARLKLRQDQQPFQSAILLNGTEVPQVPILDNAGGRLTARITPQQSGDNRIQLRLSNIWGATRLSDVVPVRYLRPPRVSQVAITSIQGRPFADLTARVDSPADLSPKDARVEIERSGQGGPGRVEWLDQKSTFDRKVDHWTMSVSELPLEPGENRFRIWVSNNHGQSREPGRSETITYRPPRQPEGEEIFPLVVEIVSPGDKQKLPTPLCDVEFSVRSASPPHEIKLVQRNDSGKHVVLFQSDAAPARPGAWAGTFERKLKVELWPEENRFELQAKNAGGTKKDHVTVRYVQRPVRVVIDSLVAPKAGGREFKPEILTNNRAQFPEPLPSSWVVLKGRVIWDSASAHKKFENADLLVRVNGTLCSKLKLVPQLDNELEDRFETGVRLATPTSHVKVDLAGVPTESIAAGDFTVTCEAKNHWERLHLLVIGVGPYKADQLRDQALSAFKGGHVDHSTGRFKSPAFQEDGYLYGPLVGEAAQRNHVLNLLDRIHEALIKPETSLDEAPTEIIVIYYVGDERHTTDATALRLGAGEGEEVEMEEISQYFSETRGNQVFLLDVNHDPDRDTTLKSPRAPDDLASLVRDPRQALPVVLRISWNGRSGSPQVAPPSADRLQVVTETLSRASTLKQLDEGFRNRYDRLRQQYTSLVYSSTLPESLQALIIGPGAMASESNREPSP